MRLLVTRPQPDADRTAAALAAAGHKPVVQPVQTVEYLPPPSVREPAAIALTSRNGARALARWPAAAAWRRLPVFAVGVGTAAEAGAAGFMQVRSANGDGKALAAYIITNRDPKAGRVLYPAAEDRSPALETTLHAKGFDVQAVGAYRMTPTPRLDTDVVDALSKGSIDGILLYSPRSAAAFGDLVRAAELTPALASVTIYAISQATADVLDWVPGAIVVAASPDEDAMMRAIPSFSPKAAKR